ncbi:MAG: hypothetical protein OEW04_08525 [Nitrospirota bacterium]|nr:hypothetical protein [Nitrospirota bacterium]
METDRAKECSGRLFAIGIALDSGLSGHDFITWQPGNLNGKKEKEILFQVTAEEEDHPAAVFNIPAFRVMMQATGQVGRTGYN